MQLASYKKGRTTVAKNNHKETAAKFVAFARERGFTIDVRSSHVVSVSKHFTPRDANAYTDAEMDSSTLLGLAPHKGGSVWGTDGGSVGGAVALQNGDFRMCKSGNGAANWSKEVARLLAAAR